MLLSVDKIELLRWLAQGMCSGIKGKLFEWKTFMLAASRVLRAILVEALGIHIRWQTGVMDMKSRCLLLHERAAIDADWLLPRYLPVVADIRSFSSGNMRHGITRIWLEVAGVDRNSVGTHCRRWQPGIRREDGYGVLPEIHWSNTLLQQPMSLRDRTM